ncbi:ABC transporter permease [Marivirga atlantica]|jgi:putative ABC transport system permease protein|uniref:ABC transporter permease n=1 Tax=Marivirga atlantica TaxID=1548457 RepID=A0A937DLG2_9BACT|nr:ABC transporter permease [Marivirga atlantica]MBL0767074.1 ABC transporter permease [Marivirga atlantica]
MLKNYIKIAFRNLMKYKLYTGINLVGLSVGLGISTLIFIFVQHENSFDDFHENKDHITRGLWESGEVGNASISASTPLALPDVLKEEFDEVKYATHYINTGGLIKAEGQQSIEESYFIISGDFFEIFSFETLYGSSNPFGNNETNSKVVITETMAQKFFGKSDVVGETLLFQLGASYEPFKVASVLKDLPNNSSLNFQILLPEQVLKTIAGDDYNTRWFNTFGGSFVQLKPEASINNLEAGIAQYIDKTLPERSADDAVFNILLQPIEQMHLDSEIHTDLVSSTNPKLLWILSGVSMLILLIACINFTTLSIGRSATRAKEVGVRKTMGALHKQLFGQFMMESVIITVVSALIGLVIANLLQPVLNDLFGKSLQISFGPEQILIIVGLLFVITFIAGAYPALFLSQLKPIAILKNNLNVNFGKQGLRKFLLGFQLFLSLFLIACTLIMYKQMQTIKNYDLGFTTDQILLVNVPAIPDQDFTKIISNSFEKAEKYRRTIAQEASIEKTAIGNATNGANTWWQGGIVGKDGSMRYFEFSFVGVNYADLLDLDFVAGRNFSADIPSDSNAIIINQAFADMMNMENPLEQRIETKGDEYADKRIIGVMKDFHHAALYSEIKPVIIALKPATLFEGLFSLNINGGTNPTVFVKASSNNFTQVIDKLKSSWNNLYPEEPFTFSFLDEVVQQQYEADQQLGKMVGMAALVAIIIASMGLFALASLAISGRLKEIGIRKVMGASAFNISVLFNKEFLKITVIGVVAALPVSYWLMNEWLKQFEVKTAPGLGVFVLTVLLGVFFTILIVSVQTINASLTNPIKTLKDE